MIHRRLSLLLPVLALLFVPSEVFGQSGFSFSTPGPGFSAPEKESGPPASRSYGWQIGLVDGASTLVFLTGVGSDSLSVGLLGMGGYLVGGPIVHSSHGNHGRALGSLALRVGLPVLLAKIAVGFDGCDPQTDDYCGEDETAHRLLGGMVGVLAASTLDWFVLGRVDTEDEPPGLQLGGVHLQPTITPMASGGQLGVFGSF